MRRARSVQSTSTAPDSRHLSGRLASSRPPLRDSREIGGKTQRLKRITKVKPRITKSDRSTRKGVRSPMGGEVLCLLTSKHLPQPFGNALPSAQKDHFRYPLFHSRYPFMPLSKSLPLPANARATDESRPCRLLCYPTLRRAH